jgi:lysophospholipase L1-like esterase
LIEKRTSRAAACAAVAAVVAACLAPATAVAGPPCAMPPELVRLDRPLPRMAQRLEAREPLRIVALGSSSTAGAGASVPGNSYPSRLQVDLRGHLAAKEVTVINRGVGGEEAQHMLARFASAVVPERPDLIIWQVGTNSVLRDHTRAAVPLIDRGIAMMKATGADVIVMDPQFAPKVIEKRDAHVMVDLIAQATKETNVGLFRRFAMMRYWREVQHIPFSAFVSSDGLHMNDWSYACVAKALAGAIAEAATRAVAFAGVPAGKQ